MEGIEMEDHGDGFAQRRMSKAERYSSSLCKGKYPLIGVVALLAIALWRKVVGVPHG